nr:hypothetical protein [Pseudobutyrivibrio sp.]
ENLSKAIAQKVPHYMIPDIYVQIEEIPLSENGKVDRKKLPKIEIKEEVEEKQEPVGEKEKQLAAIYKEILGNKEIYRNTDFFAAGGNSVLAIRLIAKIKEVFSTKISVMDIFEYGNLCELASKIEDAAPYANSEKNINIIERYSDMKFPLSYAQESMWIECVMEHSSRHTLAAYVDVSGVLDVEDMERALNKAVQYYDLTKAVIRVDDNFDPYLTLLKESDYKLNYKDISEVENKDLELADICKKEAETIFDLENGPLCNFSIIKVREKEYRILIAMHHIISDDISLHLFMQKWLDSRNIVDEISNDSNAIGASTQKYIMHGISEKDRELGLEEKEYMEQLIVNSQMLKIPGTVYTERTMLESAYFSVELDEYLYKAFKQICAKYRASLYMGFLAAFLILLQRTSHEKHITVGTPISSRSSNEIDVMGLMINMELVHAELEIEKDSFLSILEKIYPLIIGYVDKKYIPFSNLLRKLNADDAKKYIPHHIVYNYLEKQEFINMDSKIKLGELQYINNVVGHNFGLTVKVEKEKCHCIFSYKPQYIESSMVDDLANRFIQVLTRIVDNPKEKIMLGVEESD